MKNGDSAAGSAKTGPGAKPTAARSPRIAAAEAGAEAGADVRQALIDAAVELFYERGYEATGVQDIVDRAQRTKGALYHYFRSKEDLLVEIHNEVMESLAAQGRTIQDEQLSATESLGRIVQVMISEVKQRRAHFTVAFLETRIDFDRHPSARVAGEEWRSIVASVIDQGRRTGEFRRDVDPDVALWSTFGTCIWAAFHWFPDRSKLSAKRVGEMFTALVLNGLAGPI